jgi:protein TonB
VSSNALSPTISPADRLGLTLFFAVATHALVILGISFDMDKLLPEDIPLSMEITLVHSTSEEAPDKADYLAQANQKGGGSVKEKLRPSSPVSNPRPNPEKGDAEQSLPLTAPPPQPLSEQQQLMTTEMESRTQIEQPKKHPQPPLPDAPSAAELMLRSREIARLSAEIRQKQQAYAQMPREKYISANTRESIYAAYQDGWRQKVERIGNLNYPDQAKQRNLSGSLLMDVAIKPDGSLESVKLLRSSGHKVLDDGAIRIVKMAAPFAPLPPNISKDVDILHITRVWQFHNDNSLQAGK